MGKLLIIIGVVLILAGVFLTYQSQIPFFGKLPGDIRVEKNNFKFYFPITTSILVSLLVSLVIYLINRWKQ